MTFFKKNFDFFVMEVVDDENPDGVDLTGGFASYMDGVSLKVAQTSNEN